MQQLTNIYVGSSGCMYFQALIKTCSLVVVIFAAKVNVFYKLQFLLMPGLVIQMILLKVTQESDSLQLRNQNIKLVQKLLKSYKNIFLASVYGHE